MIWRGTARRFGAAAMVMVVGLTATAGISLLPRPAGAQSGGDYERNLAGIRLNSKSTAVLRAFGNPNDVVIGDVGVRVGPPGAGGGTGGSSGGPTFGSGGQSGPPAAFGMGNGGQTGAPAFGAGGGPGGISGLRGGGGFGGGGFRGPGGGGDEDGGGGGGFPGGPGGFPGGPGGFPGGPGSLGGPGGATGAGGPTIGGFGQTTSTLARQQEVTWIYNRKAGKNQVSYEFLIGPDGNVIQIRATGYFGGLARTRRGVTLGSTYKQVVQMYGYPEEHQRVGNVLIASYKSRNHIQFQFLNQKGQTDPFDAGNKCIAITIATTE